MDSLGHVVNDAEYDPDAGERVDHREDFAERRMWCEVRGADRRQRHDAEIDGIDVAELLRAVIEHRPRQQHDERNEEQRAEVRFLERMQQSGDHSFQRKRERDQYATPPCTIYCPGNNEEPSCEGPPGDE